MVAARKENWAMLLSDYLKSRKAMPFIWGENDCLMFAAKAVEAITGESLYAGYPVYATEAEAVSILENHGGVVGIISKSLGGGGRNVLTAKRGDVAIVKMPEITAGIVDDSGRSVALIAKEGLIRVPLSKAWRIWSY